MKKSKPVMLAPNELGDITNIQYPKLISTKYNGFRAVYIPSQGLRSRTDKPFRNTRLPEYFKCLEASGEVVLDCEIYAHGSTLDEIKSLITKGDRIIDLPIKLYVFDAIPLADWEAGSCDLPYSERLTLVRKTVNKINDYTKVIDVPADTVNSSAEAVKIYKESLTKGYEGCMIRSESGLYQWKRLRASSEDILKLKPFNTEDLVVTGIFEGREGLAFEGTLGGIICDYNGVEVRAGSGFKLPERKAIFENPDEYIGKIAEIKYFEKTKAGALTQPTFQRWRDDK